MATAVNITALLTLFVGVFFLAAALGGLSHPGLWDRMVDEIEKSPFSQFVGGMLSMLIGFVLIALVPPTGEWLNWVLFAVGLLALLVGFIFLIAPGRVLSVFHPLLRRASRFYALFGTVVGLGFCIVGFTRL